MPGQPFDNTIGSIIPKTRICSAALQIRQRMRKCRCRAPWHGKHEVHGDPQGLSTVYMSKTRRICDNCICHKRRSVNGVIFETGLPTSFQHLSHHGSLSLDVSLSQTLHSGNETGVLDHVSHEVCRITSNRVEFQARVANESVEDLVRSQANTMAVLLQFLPESNKRLYITSTSHDLDDDIKLNLARNELGIIRRWTRSIILAGPGDQAQHGLARTGIEIDLDTAVLFCIISKTRLSPTGRE